MEKGTLIGRGRTAEIFAWGEGQVLKRLTDNAGIDTSPAWSPDGTQIAFVSNRLGTPQIWVMGADGSGRRRLVQNTDKIGAETPSWSPAGPES